MLQWAGQKRGAFDPWLGYLEVHREDAEAEFIAVWGKVRFLPGQGPLENAHDEARVNPLTLPREMEERRSSGYPKFVSLAGWLQVLMGARPIYLPGKKVAELLKVSEMCVSRYREWAEEDGFLRTTAEADFKGKGKNGKAAEYVFDVSRCPMLQGRAEKGAVELFAGGPGAPRYAAREVVEHYQRVVGSTHPPNGAERAVEALLRQGQTAERLKQSADAYLRHCLQQRQEPKFRESARTFYGPDGNWQYVPVKTNP